MIGYGLAASIERIVFVNWPKTGLDSFRSKPSPSSSLHASLLAEALCMDDICLLRASTSSRTRLVTLKRMSRSSTRSLLLWRVCKNPLAC